MLLNCDNVNVSDKPKAVILGRQRGILDYTLLQEKKKEQEVQEEQEQENLTG